MTTAILSKFKAHWHHTMYRIKDPKVTVSFFEKHFGMKFVTKLVFDQWKFSLYFMAILPGGVTVPGEPGSDEANEFLWKYNGTLLEFTHNYGTEATPDFKYNNGNVEPNRGFGHVAFNCDDVWAASAKLEAEGVKFHKRPDEGRMKGIAFALDPDGYWLELVKRSESAKIPTYFNLSQTMLRIKDPEKSIPFYRDVLGMTLVRTSHHPEGKFSNFFFAYLPSGTQPPADTQSPEASAFVHSLWQPVMELTHNHGTESDPNFKYHNGNDEPQGFGHIGITVDDVQGACEALEQKGVPFRKKLGTGGLKNIAFILDPDNYSFEIVPIGFQHKH